MNPTFRSLAPASAKERWFFCAPALEAVRSAGCPTEVSHGDHAQEDDRRRGPNRSTTAEEAREGAAGPRAEGLEDQSPAPSRKRARRGDRQPVCRAAR